MKQTEIRREPVKLGMIGEPDKSLAQDALEILGYNAEASAARHENRNIVPKLKAALAKLEIEFLNHIDVEKYKLEKLCETLKERLAENPERCPFAYWSDCEIKDYREPIPEFVLNKAIQIKREVPECEIKIDMLDGNPDPFLVVSIGYQERYYIEVWDEPTFKVR